MSRCSPRGDAVLTELIAREPTTPAEILEFLVEFEAWARREADPRGSFAAAYAIVTRALLEALDAGEFRDPEWVCALVVDFFAYYRDALAAALDQRAQLPCWSLALTPAPLDGRRSLQSLLLAMIAHIHYDLAHSLHRVAPMDAVRDADYERIGSVLGRATPQIFGRLVADYTPEFADLHHALRGLDVRLTDAIVQRWRSRSRAITSRMTRGPGHASWWSRRLQTESTALALVCAPLILAGTSLLPSRGGAGRGAGLLSSVG